MSTQEISISNRGKSGAGIWLDRKTGDVFWYFPPCPFLGCPICGYRLKDTVKLEMGPGSCTRPSVSSSLGSMLGVGSDGQS